MNSPDTTKKLKFEIRNCLAFLAAFALLIWAALILMGTGIGYSDLAEGIFAYGFVDGLERIARALFVGAMGCAVFSLWLKDIGEAP
jgi:hypothetical protein